MGCASWLSATYAMSLICRAVRVALLFHSKEDHPMNLNDLQPGDILYAANPIHNDGGIPDLASDALLAETGTRGVLLDVGRLEADPEQQIFLVRFENSDGDLGPPVGCLPEELALETGTHE